MGSKLLVSRSDIVSDEERDGGGSLDVASNASSSPASAMSGDMLHFEPDFVKHLPERTFLESSPADAKACHKSCAVVGNSGQLLMKHQGAMIDAHEAVMRINHAPIHHFGQHVGRKTTYDLANRQKAKWMLRRFKTFKWRHPRDRAILFFEVASPTNRRQLFAPLMEKNGEEGAKQTFAFLHPKFVQDVANLWQALRKELTKKNASGNRKSGGTRDRKDKPMSGMYAVMFMLQICERVDLFGFDAYTDKSAFRRVPYHYFDGEEVSCNILRWGDASGAFPF